MQQNIDLMKINLMKRASEKLYAIIYLENSDQNKFAGVIKTLSQQKSFGNDQFPNTIVEASAILSNHNYESNKIINAQRNANKINAEINKNIEKGENQNENHAPIPTLSFAQLKIRCYCCEKRDINPLNANTKIPFRKKIGRLRKQKDNSRNQTIVSIMMLAR